MPGFFDNVGVEKVTNNSIYDQLYADIAEHLNVGYGIILPEITKNDKGERVFNWKDTSYTNNIPACVNMLMEDFFESRNRIVELEDKIKELERKLSDYETQRFFQEERQRSGYCD